MSLLAHLPAEEKGNVYTHFLGVLASIFGGYWLLIRLNTENPRVLLGAILYLSSLLVLFSASTIYHAAAKEYRSVWQRVDHIAIYFLIAGSYTPVGLTVLFDSSGPVLIAAVWGLAAFGLVYKLFFFERWNWLSLVLYLAMGWLVVLEFESVRLTFSPTALNYLLLGGFSYTIGVVFYRWYSWKWHHLVWHVFVLGGAFFHYLMVVALFQQMDYL